MWNWMSVGGGDGFQNAIDPTNPQHLLSPSRRTLGIERYDIATGQTRSIKPNAPVVGGRGGGGGGGAGGGGGRGNIIPEPPAGHAVIQFNWNSPIVLSPHDPNVHLPRRQSALHLAQPGDTWTMTKDAGQERRPQPASDSRRRVRSADLRASLTLSTAAGGGAGAGGGGGGGGGGGRGGGSRPGEACIMSKDDGYVGERVRHADRNRRVAGACRAFSGPAPTTATCRSARTAA